jgi:hypothetical protein
VKNQLRRRLFPVSDEATHRGDAVVNDRISQTAGLTLDMINKLSR